MQEETNKMITEPLHELNIPSQDSDEFFEFKTDVLSSLLRFTQVFFQARTGRPFAIDRPDGRESPQITICKALVDCFRLNTTKLLINIQPGSGKSELLKHFVAWSMARYPDSCFIYCSYSKDLATEHTFGIKQIMELPLYKAVCGVKIRHDSSAKDHFRTEQGGTIYAAGAAGSITGFNAGLPPLDDPRFTGCLIMDDMHKPDEVHSDTARDTVKRNYIETLSKRPRSAQVPQIFIGQRLHEDDLPGCLIEQYDGYEWKKVILPAIDHNNNVLMPRIKPLKDLLIEREKTPYAFASQFQQNPIPSGGAIFKDDYFIETENEPDIFATFITADTAETDKTYNDPTVFSFWGIYNVLQNGVKTDLLALHWLDCRQVWVEPKDLEPEFYDFYTACMRHKIKPLEIAIEKKSTGVTLASVLSKVQGLHIIDIERTRASGNKATRYLETQKYAASKLITLPRYGKHNQMIKDHMSKITANDSHAHDDICDTYYDAVKLALIDKVISGMHISTASKKNADAIAARLMSTYQTLSSNPFSDSFM
jgi:predicted phage terminase large subunit-like protein